MESNQLEEVKTRIAVWRKQNQTTRGRRMPEEIWEAVLAAAKDKSPNEVAKAVGLNPANIYRRLEQTEIKRRKRKKYRRRNKRARKIEFIELKEKARSFPYEIDREPKIEVILEKSTGNKLHLRYPKSCFEQLPSLLDQLLKAA